MSAKVVSAKIGPMPKRLFDPMPNVTVRLDDGTEQDLFSFYPDEINFTEYELIGLTVNECFKLKVEKDKRYLTT